MRYDYQIIWMHNPFPFFFYLLIFFFCSNVFGSIGGDLHIYRREDNDVETLLKAVIEKFDAFEMLSEAEKREQKDLYRERILKKN